MKQVFCCCHVTYPHPLRFDGSVSAWNNSKMASSGVKGEVNHESGEQELLARTGTIIFLSSVLLSCFWQFQIIFGAKSYAVSKV